MKKYCFLFFLVFFSYSYAISPFAVGLDAYARSDWKKAIEKLQEAVNNAKSEEEIETSLYYLIMSLASSGNYKNAVNVANIFLARYPKSDKHPIVMYQRGRLYCLLSLYEKSLKELYEFIRLYPKDPSIPSAYYWVGESLYLSGKLQEGRDVFSRILLNYPTSPKAELAKQRISLIDQAATQRELLALLKINQEQTQNLAAEMAQRQKDFESAMQNFKDQKDDSEIDIARYADIERILQEERDKNAELYEKLLVLEAKNKELLEALAMLDQLEKEKPIEEEPKEDVKEEISDEDAEKERLAREAAERRRLVLEMLKRKARQLEGMYDEILEEEKNDKNE